MPLSFRTALLIIALLSLGSASASDQITIKKQPNIETKKEQASIAPSSQHISDTTVTIAVLKAQNELMKSFDDRIISTVFWALGTIVTITIGLIAFGWWSNIRVNEKEFRVLANELRNQTNAELEKIRTELTSNQAALTKAITNEVVTEKVTPSIRKMDSVIGNISRDLNRVQYTLETQEAEMWTIKGVHSNAISRYVSAATHTLRMNDLFSLQIALKGVLSAFRAATNKSDKTLGEITRLELAKVIDSAPKEVADLIHAIREEMTKAA